MATFHPQRSTVKPDKFAEFLDMELTGNLLEVPGIGPSTVTALKTVRVSYSHNGQDVVVDGISNTYSLIGVYLSMKSDGDRLLGTVEHAQRFYLWWCSLGVSAGHRAGVIHCICEKVNISFPGIYNAAEFGEYSGP